MRRSDILRPKDENTQFGPGEGHPAREGQLGGHRAQVERLVQEVNALKAKTQKERS